MTALVMLDSSFSRRRVAVMSPPASHLALCLPFRRTPAQRIASSVEYLSGTWPPHRARHRAALARHAFACGPGGRKTQTGFSGV